MIKTESGCVSCGFPCIGFGCKYYRTQVPYCDICGEEGFDYEINGEDYCEPCAKKYLDEMFKNLSITEKANMLEIDILNVGFNKPEEDAKESRCKQVRIKKKQE